ncbi:MAG: D-glycero-beta-D-manno-heptose 1-phosphate adenylyltransferase [Candidatus Omnitrophica bacterium]|nr:D-glycero-beta-D-manno-heptose 1-phosphate adenylyltransferase [Candidatus Omnitrophota bacterium]
MINDKIVQLEQLKKIVLKKKEEGKRIVFTNGCFDIIHSGHVEYLEDAAKKGDVLIVAVNSDTSVKKIKGETRPIISQNSRMKVVAALESVDYVVCFDDETPYDLISQLVPNVLVKGGDWSPEQIIGADIVFKNGGVVESIQFRPGFSTTTMINKIRNT